MALALGGIAPQPQAAEAKPEPGLLVTFATEGRPAADTALASGVTLYVVAGQAPTPFLPGGKFTATWDGAINAELRGDFIFQSDLNGSLKVEINGATALEATGTGGASPLSPSIRLNKGANVFKAIFTSPAQGDAFVRLNWAEKPPFTGPIPPAAFTHTGSTALTKATQLRLGRELFLDHRCIQCHTDKTLTESGVPELKLDAPSLEGIGARRQFDWMARWILDPKSLRPSAQMPKLLHGPAAKEDAEAIAAYLASLRTGGETKTIAVAYRTRQNPPKEGEETAPAGEAKPLYERLHCIGCHNPPDAKEPDPKKLSQKRIAEKFPAGKLAEYLLAPEAHYAWTRMPNFHLSAQEAKELEDWLFAAAPKAESKPAPTDAATIERGKKLVQTKGCLNCHALKLENQFSAPDVGILESRHRRDRSIIPVGDCLGATPAAAYSFTTNETAALDAFTRAGFASLSRHVPADFAERHTRALNCNACHGQLENFPPLEILGGKLKPEWAAQFIAGAIPRKMRFDFHPKGEPWLEARMPAFPARAPHLAAGLAAQLGHPPKSPVEPPVDGELAKIGHKLIGKDGGFSCISCHAVGPALAQEVFESEGINLADTADRLLPEYYRRWFRNPTSIDPQTKMPNYFGEGQSPFTDILGGDVEKQISAVWEYFKQRGRMAPPRTGAE